MFFASIDHMLSYFLGGEAPQGSTGPHFASFASSASAPAALRPEEHDEDADPAPPPPTPVLQHFLSASSSANGAIRGEPRSYPPTTVTTSGSSSSLSSMAAALVSGGPMLQQFHDMHLPHRDSMGSLPIARKDSLGSFSLENPSPISPAAFIGSGHENLMLPPPQRCHATHRAAKGIGSTAARGVAVGTQRAGHNGDFGC
jgi:hypothetical protein